MLLHYLTTGSRICDYRWLLHPHLLSSIWYHHPTPAQREECIRSDQKDFSFKLNTISAKVSKGFSVAPLDPWKQPFSFPAHEEAFSCSSAAALPCKGREMAKQNTAQQTNFPHRSLTGTPGHTHTASYGGLLAMFLNDFFFFFSFSLLPACFLPGISSAPVTSEEGFKNILMQVIYTMNLLALMLIGL